MGCFNQILLIFFGLSFKNTGYISSDANKAICDCVGLGRDMGNCNSQARHEYDVNSIPAEGASGTNAPLHQGCILGHLEIDNGQVITCSEDKTIGVIDKRRLFTNRDYRPAYMMGHTKAVNRLAWTTIDQSIWSASRDLSLKQVQRKGTKEGAV